MAVWFTSDTHFCHKNIINLGKGRPFRDIKHHDEMIIKNWNEMVMPDDDVWHLGDVALGPWPEGLNCVKRLNGRLRLVPGNHDRISSVESLKRQERFLPDYEDAFYEICNEVEMVALLADKEKAWPILFMMSHYPYNGDSHDGDRFTSIRPVDKGMKLLHGHTHSQDKISYSDDGTLQISVGMDAWGYRPVAHHEIIDLIDGLTDTK